MDYVNVANEIYFLTRLAKPSKGHVITKGQLISKANCQAADSPKKRTDEFAFFNLKSSYLVKSNAVCSFFWRIYGALFCLRF